VLFACISSATSAEEYYSLGMAYFELGKYEEAEKWLNRAKSSDKTMVASRYNLGRLAFERQRYNDAAKYFEDILIKDRNNVLALKAAAYTRIKTGDIDIAEKHYSNLMELVPESADDGYNHALVLYAMERYSDAEAVLEKYILSLLGNSDVQLLHARSQAAQNKVEAINSLSSWLNNNTDTQVRYEYALVLERHEYYARAMEEYRKALTEDSTNKELNNNIRFALARTLLIADNTSAAGITELQTVVKEGFNDITAVEELLTKEKISQANKRTIENIINDMKLAASGEEEKPASKL
jgi:tetratricopeptide (TPR) repeat protein